MKRRIAKSGECSTGKKRFRDRRSATAAVSRFKQTSTRATVPTRVYECPACKGWHLTSRALR